MKKEQSTISFVKKLGYGVGNITYSLPYQAVATFFIFYATVILKVPPSLAGIALAISAVWDAVADPVVGHLSDNVGSKRFGKRHPYLLTGSIMIAVFSYLLWSIDPSASEMYKFWSLLILVILIKTALSIYVVPYNALGGELSKNYDEQSSIQGVRAFFYLTGMIIAIAGGTIIFFKSTPLYERGQLNPEAYPAMGIVFSLIAILAVIPVLISTKKNIISDYTPSDKIIKAKFSLSGIFKDVKSSLKDKNFSYLMLMIFIIEVGFQFGIAIGIHVNTYTYHLTGPQMGILVIILLLTSILSQPLWVWFSKRSDKKNTIMLGAVIGLIGFIGAPWTHVWWQIFPIDQSSILFTLSIFHILAGLGNGAFMSMPYSMVADNAEIQRLKTGKSSEGLHFGLYIFAYKIGTSVSLFISGFALALIGFNAQVKTQSAETAFNLAMVPTYLLLLTFPIAIYFISKYKLTREKYEDLLKSSSNEN